MTVDTAAVVALLGLGGIVWVGVAISQHRAARRKPLQPWYDVPKPKKPWPKDDLPPRKKKR